MSGIASLESIRSEFPALERMHAGASVAYFDGPGGTQVPQEVAEAVSGYLLRHNANTHWGFPTSAETDRIVEAGREAAADLLGGEIREIVFGPNMTTLTFQLARALGRQFAPGTEIVVTQLDHRANVDPWLDMAHMWNLTVRTVPFRPSNGTLDWDVFESVVGERTGLIAIGQRARHGQRRGARGCPGARRREPVVRRCGPLGTTPPNGRFCLGL
jgi:selenocysteine lyase/cysteine desulfurase